MPLLASLALPYALVLLTPGPNLLIVLRIAMRPSWSRSVSVAAGIASGATIASFLAALGASTVKSIGGIDRFGTLLLSSILLYSAWRLVRNPPKVEASEPPAQEMVRFRLFGLGLATALSNPLSVPFFVSFYLAEPGFRTVWGSTTVCAIIFLMALAWFTAVGHLFSVSAVRRVGLEWRQGARYVLAIAMGFYALKVLFA